MQLPAYKMTTIIGILNSGKHSAPHFSNRQDKVNKKSKKLDK